MPERLLSNRPLRYGQIGGPEVPVVPMELSASFVFNNEGGRLVALDSSGQLVLGGDTTEELIGGVVWGGDYTGSATAGTVVGVNLSTDALWLLPLATGGASSARTEAQLKALIRKVADLDIISNIQYVDYAVSTHDVVQIVDYRYWGSAAGEQAVVVRISPKEIGQTGV